MHFSSIVATSVALLASAPFASARPGYTDNTSVGTRANNGTAPAPAPASPAPAPAPGSPAPAPVPGVQCNGTTLDGRTFTVTVQQGQTLGDIAKQVGRGTCDIAKFNNLPDANSISPNQVLNIPPQVCYPDNTSCLPPSKGPTDAVLGGPTSYRVMKDDTFDKVAQALNLNPDALAKANGGSTTLPAQGQFINVPVVPGSFCDITTYVIKQGDVYFTLAQGFGTTYGQIIAINPNVEPTNIPVGFVITAPKNCRASGASTSGSDKCDTTPKGNGGY